MGSRVSGVEGFRVYGGLRVHPCITEPQAQIPRPPQLLDTPYSPHCSSFLGITLWDP